MKPDSYRRHLSAFTSRILVICPSCAGPALVKAPGIYQKEVNQTGTRLTCGQCGYSNTMKDEKGSCKLLGSPVDPYFQQPLLLTRACCGQVLWAYNREHLDLLKQHIRAVLRERNGLSRANKSIGSRLPRWMTAAGNRQQLLKAIGEMEKIQIPVSGY